MLAMTSLEEAVRGGVLRVRQVKAEVKVDLFCKSFVLTKDLNLILRIGTILSLQEGVV